MPGDYDIEYASPWAGANVLPVGKPGSQLHKFEEATWPELDRICRDVPEAGIHYQNTVTLGRTKDAGSAVGEWFSELVKEDAWFSKTLPDVSYHNWRHGTVSSGDSINIICLRSHATWFPISCYSYLFAISYFSVFLNHYQSVSHTFLRRPILRNHHCSVALLLFWRHVLSVKPIHLAVSVSIMFPYNN
jgi:hypothetical protein